MISKGKITKISGNGREVDNERRVLKLNGRKGYINCNIIIVLLFAFYNS